MQHLEMDEHIDSRLVYLSEPEPEPELEEFRFDQMLWDFESVKLERSVNL